tara:strand:- start:1195 stop:1590 length:396 start_codon:yes stop_codon:yes gene_type:complete
MKVKICIVISTYNEDITKELYASAKKELEKSGIKKIDTVEVPGAFEIPMVISKLANKYDGFIAIGCIIKGETANFDLISNAITNGIMQLSIIKKKPIGNSIITAFNREQGMKRFHRGEESAKAVLKVLKIK